MAAEHRGHTMGAAHAAIAPAGFGSQAAVRHRDSEFGYNVDMRAEDPQRRLSDPGVGLRNNGRRVLTYADLFNLYPAQQVRDPEREIQLHLTGSMERYLWSINGISFTDAEPLPLRLNQRVRITLVNDTMMNHPIHLHGMWSELETDEPTRIPLKHTVIVQPGSQISYLVTPEVAGPWAYHCHLLYHMTGMFRRVEVS
jgi:FtsP/CotA-like multicopper oxidase with cupredoxin domain